LNKKKKDKIEEMPMPKLPLGKLPRSHIVYGSVFVKSEWKNSDYSLLDQYKVRALSLFERYVDSNTAELEINLSFQERKNLTTLFDREKYWKKDGISCEQLLTVWDISIRSMVHLMGDSFSRFVRTPEFEHVTKHFSGKNREQRLSISLSVKNIKAVIMKDVEPMETETKHDKEKEK